MTLPLTSHNKVTCPTRPRRILSVRFQRIIGTMRIIIVDDEPLARADLREILTGDLGQQVVAECGDANEARRVIAARAPDAIFLDIEMPRQSGLQLAAEFDAAGHPPIVFVTAHAKYACDAFDVSPVDYVLKPVDPSRCRRAVRRLERLLQARRGVTGDPSGAAPAAVYLDRVFVKDAGRLVHLPMRDIEALEAMGNYVKIHARSRTFIVRATLTSIEARLNPAIFLRTHRSHIVNLAKINELVLARHGDFTIILQSGHTLPLSRVYRDRFDLFVLSGFPGETPAQSAS
jgi:two-component system, LytTR family, response regulator